MQRENSSVFAALLIGLLANTLLRTQTEYWFRAGMLVAPLCVLALAVIGRLFSFCWAEAQNILLQRGLVALLIGFSAIELLRLWYLVQRIYPRSITLPALCLMVLLPGIYLRRISALSQTAHVLLCLLVICSSMMLISILPRLHITNLQVQPLNHQALTDAAKSQLMLSPEYLLPAIWPKKQKKDTSLPLLAALALAFDIVLHGMLELFYGAAMPMRADPLHAAARCGAISVFNRLEWMQLILWMMAVSLKLAVYRYAVACLLGHDTNSENTAEGLCGYVQYAVALLVLCAFLQGTALEAALQYCTVLLWGFILLTVQGGVAIWLAKKCRCS